MNPSGPPRAIRILLGREYSARSDVVRAIGDVMLASGDVTPRYVQGMLRKEELHGTWVTEGVALPHGTDEVKGEVVRNTMVFVQVPEGVDWGNGRIVRLAIGFAGKGDEQHLKMLAALAGVLQRRDLVDRLAVTRDETEALRILSGLQG